ncbi:MAG: hypothetical protein V7603_5157 [Micromonosporaceae bacterium]
MIPQASTGVAVLSCATALAALGFGTNCFRLRDLVRDRQRIQVILRWQAHVLTSARQQKAAESFPEVGVRLGWLYYLADRLRKHAVVRDGWLPGVSVETLDRLQYALTAELLDTVDLRAVTAKAADRPGLADRVAVGRAELAAADAAFDTQLSHLDDITQTADEIGGRLDDLALAERLDASTPSSIQLRQRLAATAATDLEALATAARAAADVVGEAVRGHG